MTLDNEKFINLINKVELKEDDSNSYQIVFKGKLDCYEMDCYINCDNEMDFNINEYGSMIFGNWTSLTTTDFQYELLKSKVLPLADEFLKQFEKDEFEFQEDDLTMSDFDFWHNIKGLR